MNPGDFVQAILFVVLAVITSLGVLAMRRYAERKQILDIPNERSSHSRPTPRGGGLAMVVVTLVTFGAPLLLPSLFGHGLNVRIVLAYLVGGGLIAAVSWIDDIRTLPNRIRFGAHSLAAILIIAAAGPWNAVQSGPSLIHLGVVLGSIITFLWITGLTNAYNFMDGIDGIAGMQALVAGIGWMLLGRIWESSAWWFGLVLAAAALGFLIHNWPYGSTRARIFMGDVGSAFLGFSFAALPVIAAREHPQAPLAGILLLWPFLFDAVFTFVRRALRGENVFAAHRSHLYQRLNIAGWPHARISTLYGFLAFWGLCLALFVAPTNPGLALGLAVVAAVLLVALVSAVEKRMVPVG